MILTIKCELPFHSQQYVLFFTIALLFFLSINILNHFVSAETSKHLRVTFDSIKVNKDHDPLGTGEWKLMANVNDKGIDLSSGTQLWDADEGHTYDLGKSIDIVVPPNGSVKILVYGIDEDGAAMGLKPIPTEECETPPPQPASNETSDIDIECLHKKAWNVVVSLTNIDKNDLLGTLKKEYNSNSNFGIAIHEDRSSKTNGDSESEGDYTLIYRIVETGYKYEGVAGFILPQEQPGSVPLHRYWNSEISDHFYTTDFNEIK